MLVNNFDWMSRFSYLDFLRDVGKNFPVNVMLAKDSVKQPAGRRDSGLSYTEFSYMLLQAYDFVYLLRHISAASCKSAAAISGATSRPASTWPGGCRGVQLYGLTCPLLTKSDGTKMGKTESGAVWLSPARTSPYEFYQYWINVDDADAGKCLRFLTDLAHEEIESLDAARAADPAAREPAAAGRRADALVHGDAGLATARRATDIFFGAEISELDDAQLGEIFADVPSKELSRAPLAGEGLNVVDALVEGGPGEEQREARRTIEQGGAYVNNRRIEAPPSNSPAEHLASQSVMVLARWCRKSTRY